MFFVFFCYFEAIHIVKISYNIAHILFRTRSQLYSVVRPFRLRRSRRDNKFQLLIYYWHRIINDVYLRRAWPVGVAGTKGRNFGTACT